MCFLRGVSAVFKVLRFWCCEYVVLQLGALISAVELWVRCLVHGLFLVMMWCHCVKIFVSSLYFVGSDSGLQDAY